MNIQTPSSSSALTVEQLNRRIRQLIEGQIEVIWVQGEISNFKSHSSGHYYFSLKDERSQIRAVMFKGHNARLKFRLEDGLLVMVRGRVTVYEPRGEYQISCEWAEPVGAGALQKAFEQLKIRLQEEGLFDPRRKRALPALPRHIAIVTSPTGAAIRDMLQILARRNRLAQVTLIPTLVQGEGAAIKIMEAFERAINLPGVDVVILGRGGGSIEDLWAFNDESLARRIAASPVPTISAVGHEVDFTICDFVADVRAPTPSAAAELVTRSSAEILDQLSNNKRMLAVAMQRILKIYHHRLEVVRSRIVDPKRKLQENMQKTDFLTTRLHQATMRFMKDLRSRLTLQMGVLDSLSPLKTVERGFSITRKENSSSVIRFINEVHLGDRIQVRLSDGELTTQIVDLKKF